MKVYKFYNGTGFEPRVVFYCPFCRDWHAHGEHYSDICKKWKGLRYPDWHLFHHNEGDVVGYYGVENGEIKFIVGDLEMDGVECASFPLLHYL